MCVWLFRRARRLELHCYTAETSTSPSKFCRELEQNPALQERFALHRVLLFGRRRSDVELANIFLKDRFPVGVHQVVSSFVTGDTFLRAFERTRAGCRTGLPGWFPAGKPASLLPAPMPRLPGCGSQDCLPASQAAWRFPHQKALFAVTGEFAKLYLLSLKC